MTCKQLKFDETKKEKRPKLMNLDQTLQKNIDFTLHGLLEHLQGPSHTSEVKRETWTLVDSAQTLYKTMYFRSTAYSYSSLLKIL